MKKKKRRNWLDSLPLWWLKFFINLWPPFLGAGIKVTKISPDFKLIIVNMKLHWYNKNYIGTHFGGSMFSMTDPFYMLMLLKHLGRNYIVWDKASHIDFKKIARGKLTATFQFTELEFENIRKLADKNGKYVFDKHVDIVDEEEVVVASVVKTLYVRRKETV